MRRMATGDIWNPDRARTGGGGPKYEPMNISVIEQSESATGTREPAPRRSHILSRDWHVPPRPDHARPDDARAPTCRWPRLYKLTSVADKVISVETKLLGSYPKFLDSTLKHKFYLGLSPEGLPEVPACLCVVFVLLFSTACPIRPPC